MELTTDPIRFPVSDDRTVTQIVSSLPTADNTPEAMESLLSANRHLRQLEWPEPYRTTRHRVHCADARELDWIPSESVHLVVTSPPYWTLKEYKRHPAQMGEIEDYERFLNELDRVWRHCLRVLIPGGRVCCVVGDVCLARKQMGRHYVMPLHSDIQVRARKLGFDNLTPVLWHKIANGATETEGNGGGFYGKPYQPGAILKNDVEYILFFRKGGKYRSVPPLAKALSMLNREEMQAWFRSVWTDVRGASTSAHPAPYPEEVALRLIRMFSFAGDTVLDPFLGTGTTIAAAMTSGRNSLGVEIDPSYVELSVGRLKKHALRPRHAGATNVLLDAEGYSAGSMDARG